MAEHVQSCTAHRLDALLSALVLAAPDYSSVLVPFVHALLGTELVLGACLLGSINLPIIKFSVDWWNTLHQGATILKTSAPSIHPSMLIPLLAMVLAFHLHFFTVALMRIRCEILEDEKRTHWVQQLGTSR